MLTNEKVDVYVRYHGDVDGWAHSGTISEKKILSNEWSLIDCYLQDIYLENHGLLSDSYLKKHEASMLANCENGEVVARLKQLATHEYKRQEKKGLLERLMNYIFNLYG